MTTLPPAAASPPSSSSRKHCGQKFTGHRAANRIMSRTSGQGEFSQTAKETPSPPSHTASRLCAELATCRHAESDWPLPALPRDNRRHRPWQHASTANGAAASRPRRFEHEPNPPRPEPHWTPRAKSRALRSTHPEATASAWMKGSRQSLSHGRLACPYRLGRARTRASTAGH
jgi:hypothetical protein